LKIEKTKQTNKVSDRVVNYQYISILRPTGNMRFSDVDLTFQQISAF